MCTGTSTPRSSLRTRRSRSGSSSPWTITPTAGRARRATSSCGRYPGPSRPATTSTTTAPTRRCWPGCSRASTTSRSIRCSPQQLWQPAGMEASADIMTDRVGAAVASEELFARPRDFVRLGELMRNGGRTPDGRRIVSEQWIAAATTGMKPASDAGDDTVGGYGFQWWSGATPDGFQANGFQGQYITVAPSACVTGVRLAHTLQLSTDLKFAGQGNDEWHALYRAVLARLGGC
ncbi:serine hydrolase [Nocardia tengchongensis]|uniref:Serine hydrolase n=1 Tax=Nocardia tengchongensis TaxID=2055889 RepID=A0ABX8CVN9_9NOCA|nr:serine hydrolase [Nocardia tengchongensis]